MKVYGNVRVTKHKRKTKVVYKVADFKNGFHHNNKTLFTFNELCKNVFTATVVSSPKSRLYIGVL